MVFLKKVTVVVATTTRLKLPLRTRRALMELKSLSIIIELAAHGKYGGKMVDLPSSNGSGPLG